MPTNRRNASVMGSTASLTPLTWKQTMEAQDGHAVCGVPQYILISDDVSLLPLFSYPFKTDVSIALFCTRGHLRGTMGLCDFDIGPSSLIMLPMHEVLRFEAVSDDFAATYMILSKELVSDMLSIIRERMELSFSTLSSPVLQLSAEEMQTNLSYFRIMTDAISDTSNPHRRNIVLHLLLALYYRQHGHITAESQAGAFTQYEKYVLDFIQMLRRDYRRERQVKYYAGKMCLTPKYLSAIIRQQTGKTANEWIDMLVMREAKAMLKSTTMTILQISSELHFPDQSAFGKYFKQHEGISPKEYRDR